MRRVPTSSAGTASSSALALVLSTAAALVAIGAPARAASVDPSIGRVEVTLDVSGDKPYVGEMILLRMRSFIRADVVLDDIQQPPLLNFSWQQLGRDKPVEAMIDGFRIAGIERDLAIFPTTSGRLIIEPFTRRVTVVTADNERVATSFTSKPIYVDIQNYTAINPPGAWWLPAKSLSLSEAWSQLPDEIKPGTLSRRTIRVEALGLTGDRLPPPPPMQAPGTIAFRGPVERETILTDDGPVARGTYIWDLRPVSPSPALMPAIHVTWFDTQARRMRDSALPETWVALVGTLVHPSHEKPRIIGLLSPGPLAIGAAGFAWTAALVGLLVTRGRPLSRQARRRARAARALRQAGKSADPAAFSNALVALGRSDPARWARVSTLDAIKPNLLALDAARFGRGGGAMPALAPLATSIVREWRVDRGEKPQPDALPPIDSPDGWSRPRWRDRLRWR